MSDTDPSTLEVPSPPAALAVIIAAASDPSVSKQALGDLVAQEPAFALRILNIVNSSLYRRGKKVASAQKAISILGSRTLRNVALCAATQSCIQAERLPAFDLSLFWECSLQRAVGAQLCAQSLGSEGGIDPMEAFTAGLLQDLGLLALLLSQPQAARAWMDIAHVPASERRQAELEIFGQRHDDLAQTLVQTWNLPEELAQPIVWHHRPESAPEQWATRVKIAAAGECIADVLGQGASPQALGQGREQLIALLDVDQEQIDGVLGQVGDKVLEVGAALGVKVGPQPCLRKLLVQASDALVQSNLSNESLLLSLEKLLEEKDLLVRELQIRSDALERMTMTDALTTLANRRAFSRRLDAEIEARAETAGSLGVMLLDIDHFKSVNDRFGHDVGDLVLQRVAGELAAWAGPGVMVARVGGEEFGVIAPRSDLPGFKAMARAICQSIRGLRWQDPESLNQVTVSVGLARLSGPCPHDFDLSDVARRLYRGADQALYHAKKQGRDRWVMAKESIAWQLRRRAA